MKEFKVQGDLRKTYIPSIDGYKYSVGTATKKFDTLEQASTYADKVMNLTGTVLAVKEIKHH
mgnify:CR=1 FL=1